MEQKLIDNVDNAIDAWLKSSDNNFDEMLDFNKIGRNNWALFNTDIWIEKIKCYRLWIKELIK